MTDVEPTGNAGVSTLGVNDALVAEGLRALSRSALKHDGIVGLDRFSAHDVEELLWIARALPVALDAIAHATVHAPHALATGAHTPHVTVTRPRVLFAKDRRHDPLLVIARSSWPSAVPGSAARLAVTFSTGSPAAQNDHRTSGTHAPAPTSAEVGHKDPALVLLEPPVLCRVEFSLTAIEQLDSPVGALGAAAHEGGAMAETHTTHGSGPLGVDQDGEHGVRIHRFTSRSNRPGATGGEPS